MTIEPQNRFLAVFLVLIHSFCLVGSANISAMIALPSHEVAFLYKLCILIILLPYFVFEIYRYGFMSIIYTKRLQAHIGRGFISASAKILA